MRIASAVLCFSIIFSAAGAADPAPPSPTDTYIVARDRYIAEFNAHPVTDAADKRVDRVLAELERQLKAIVPPWHGSGFPKDGKLNLNGVDDNQIGLSVLSGLIYGAGETVVLVTTPALLRRWIPDHNRWWQGADDIPQPFDTAIRSEQFWTYAMFDDARTIPYSEVAVSAHSGGVSTFAMLATEAQDLVFDAGPTEILAAVVYSDRAFIARQKLAVTTSAVPVCLRRLQIQRAQSDAAYKLYQASGLRDQQMFDRHVQLEEVADRDYRVCFAEHLRELPNYAAIQKQAQTLVDLLR